MLAIVLGISAIYLGMETPYWLTSVWLAFFSVLCTIDLIRVVNKTDRELTNFLISIRQGDFSSTYPEQIRNSETLYHAFNTITREFRRVRSEKESGFHFLQAVVEHCGVPMLSYKVDGEEVTMVNQEAKSLLGIPHLSKLETLSRFNQELLKRIRELGSEEKVLVRIMIQGEQVHLSVVAKEIVLQQERYKLIAIHNINSELDQKEVESWQKLIRVLSHEIKNSVIPISTLAEVTSAMLADVKSLKDISREESDDLVLSINTIEKRSNGLVKFVSSYSDLAKIPKLELAEHSLNDLLEEVLKLQEKAQRKHRITVNYKPPRSRISHVFDKDLIVQVLINITKNAIEAMPDGGELKVEVSKKSSRTTIRVTDNGLGIEPEVLENIFIPFFTTKKEGSGIGLSLSRQILRAHGGTLRVSSKPGFGSAFEMVF